MSESPTIEKDCEWCGVRVFTYYGVSWYESGEWPPKLHVCSEETK